MTLLKNQTIIPTVPVGTKVDECKKDELPMESKAKDHIETETQETTIEHLDVDVDVAFGDTITLPDDYLDSE